MAISNSLSKSAELNISILQECLHLIIRILDGPDLLVELRSLNLHITRGDATNPTPHTLTYREEPQRIEHSTLSDGLAFGSTPNSRSADIFNWSHPRLSV